MAGGGAPVLYYIGGGGSGIHLYLGGPFWHASGPYFGQRPAVHIRAVDSGDRKPGGPASSNSGIQPAG